MFILNTLWSFQKNKPPIIISKDRFFHLRSQTSWHTHHAFNTTQCFDCCIFKAERSHYRSHNVQQATDNDFAKMHQVYDLLLMTKCNYLLLSFLRLCSNFFCDVILYIWQLNAQIYRDLFYSISHRKMRGLNFPKEYNIEIMKGLSKNHKCTH